MTIPQAIVMLGVAVMLQTAMLVLVIGRLANAVEALRPSGSKQS